ncbi:MAG: arginase family protein [Thermomicrobiales bacterium]|nr:arginase family protein [Thermomicrobiales bacterium]
MPLALTAFQGRAGDHNDLAMPGAVLLAHAIGEHLGLEPTVIGTTEPALNTNWDIELAAAMPGLRNLQTRLDAVRTAGQTSVTVLNRCAAAIATLPVIAKHHPDAVVVWFDAHADLNTPEASTTGYLGGLAMSGPAGLWDSGLGSGCSIDRLVLVGQRDIDPFEQELIDTESIALVRPGERLAERVVKAIAGRPVYVHIDCDVLDPGIVPTDYKIPNGLTLDELRSALTAIAGGDVLGLEMTEFEERFTPDTPPATAEARSLVAALAPLLEVLRAR